MNLESREDDESPMKDCEGGIQGELSSVESTLTENSHELYDVPRS